MTESSDSLFSVLHFSEPNESARAYLDFGKIRETVDAMLSKLKAQIRELNSRTYLDARGFLTSLAYEADFPAG